MGLGRKMLLLKKIASSGFLKKVQNLIFEVLPMENGHWLNLISENQ